MAKIYAIANHKGGVGKTTTALNLSASLCLNGKKVLLVDIDPQGNTTKGVGIDKDMVVNSVSDLLLNKKEVRDCMIPTQFDNLYLIPATLELASVDFDLATSDNTKQLRLKQHLDTIKNKFDYIIIDCPPSLGLLNINALIACDGVIIPVQSEYYALDGLILLLSSVSINVTELPSSNPASPVKLSTLTANVESAVLFEIIILSLNPFDKSALNITSASPVKFSVFKL